MSERKTEAEPDAKVLADISRLADGSLDPKRADVVRKLIAETPELGERYERERGAVDALRELRGDRAPAALRIAIDTRRQRAHTRRARPLYVGALGAVAAAVAALILLLPGGSPGAPSISQAAAVAMRGPAVPPPAEHGVRLRQDVQDTYFPNWTHLRWRASGKRTDLLNGRLAVTVYYARNSTQIAYTILASPPLRWTRAPMNQVEGVALQSFVWHGRTIVTWRRNGHTCVLSGSGVSAAELAELATWHAPGLDR